MRAGLAWTALVAAPSNARAQVADFSAVDTLAARALAGQGMDSPVRGFEILLLKEGHLVYHRAFGQWTLDRVARADSGTKTISAAVIMALTDASPQPFSLDTRLSTYLPAFTGAKQFITVRQAFAHTSGLRVNFIAQNDPTPSLQAAAANIADDPMLAFPGTTFSYGGTSMHAAAAAAENAAGLPWVQLFEQRLALPLAWTHTRYVEASALNPWIGGGCETTATEFSRLMEMLRRGGVFGSTRVLSESAAAQMLTRQTPIGIPINSTPLDSPFTDGADYGVGTWLAGRGDNGELLAAVAAGARGFSSWIDLDAQVVGVLSTDLSDSGNIQPVLYKLIRAANLALSCPADVDDDGSFDNGRSRDGAVTIADLLYFLAAFEAGHPGADLDDDGQPTSALPDGAVTIEDLLFYLARFETGC